MEPRRFLMKDRPLPDLAARGCSRWPGFADHVLAVAGRHGLAPPPEPMRDELLGLIA